MQIAITQGTSVKGVPFAEGEKEEAQVSVKGVPSMEEEKEEAQAGKETNTLFTIGMGRIPTVVEMEIMGYKL